MLISALAESNGVSLHSIATELQPLASDHFGDEVVVETRVEGEELQLISKFRVETKSASGSLGQETLRQFGIEAELGDELEFPIFFSPDEEAEAFSQDFHYDTLIGLSCVGCGFWPVAHAALRRSFGLAEDPVEGVLQRALLLAGARPEERTSQFRLRRARGSKLLLKEEVVVGDGEIRPGYFGRRDLVAGARVEVVRREVPVLDVVAGLFGSNAVALACEGSSVESSLIEAALAQRDVHLKRRSLFRARLERFLGEPRLGLLERFAALVSSERDARCIP